MLRSSKRGITLIELLVVIGVIVFLAILLFPAISTPRETARRSACTNKLKQIGLGLQNFANARKCFPGSSTEKFTKVGDTMPNNDCGYSWQTMILPYIEESNLYKRLDLESQPWNANGMEVLSDPNDPANLETKCHALVWSTPIDTYLCPSRDIDSDRVVGDVFQLPDGPYPKGYDVTPAATSYVALSATHRASFEGTATAGVGGRQHPNGVMYPGSKTTYKNLKDGTSNTVIVCETKEPKYSAWFSAQTAGVVGFMGTPDFGPPSDPETAKYNVVTSGKTALNQKGAGLIPGWEYGPSSDHPGVILHLFADGSVRSFTASIATETYGSLITRDGGEPVNLDYY